jgi:hypothetical protein
MLEDIVSLKECDFASYCPCITNRGRSQAFLQLLGDRRATGKNINALFSDFINPEVWH